MSFTRIVHVVNRTADQELQVTDDGIPWVIRPGYKRVERLDAEGKAVVDENGQPTYDVVGAGPGGTVFMEPLPYFAAERAKRQNPVMGTEDPYNPNDFATLIAVPEWGEDYSPLEQSPAIERLDRTLLPGDAQKVQVIGAVGARKPKTIRGKDGKFKKVIPGARSMMAGEQIENPAGIRM